MTDAEKIQKILDLLTDSTWGKLCKENTLVGQDEQFGALVLLTHVFGEAVKIAKA